MKRLGVESEIQTKKLKKSARSLDWKTGVELGEYRRNTEINPFPSITITVELPVDHHSKFHSFNVLLPVEDDLSALFAELQGTFLLSSGTDLGFELIPTDITSTTFQSTAAISACNIISGYVEEILKGAPTTRTMGRISCKTTNMRTSETTSTNYSFHLVGIPENRLLFKELAARADEKRKDVIYTVLHRLGDMMHLVIADHLAE